MKQLLTLILLLAMSFQVEAQSEARKKELIQDLKKELSAIGDNISELSAIMAEDLENELNQDSLKLRMETVKKAIRENQKRIIDYSEELSRDYELDADQKELLKEGARAFGESMRLFGEAMSVLARKLSIMIEEELNEH